MHEVPDGLLMATRWPEYLMPLLLRMPGTYARAHPQGRHHGITNIAWGWTRSHPHPLLLPLSRPQA